MRKRRCGDNEQRHYYHIFVHELFLAGSRKARRLFVEVRAHMHGPLVWKVRGAAFGRFVCRGSVSWLSAAPTASRGTSHAGTPTTNKRHHGSINLAIKYILGEIDDTTFEWNPCVIISYMLAAAKDTDSERDTAFYCC
jgi:hypothetical protein